MRRTSADLAGPALKARMSLTETVFFSRIRTASSMESSSKGFMECLTPAVSTPMRALLTRGFICGIFLLASVFVWRIGMEMEGIQHSLLLA